MIDEQMNHDHEEYLQYQSLLRTEEIENQLMDIGKCVQDGHLNAMEAFVKLYIIENLAKEVREEIRELAVDERDKYIEKDLEMYGAKIKPFQNTTYSFKHISEWVELEKKKKKVEQAAKDALRLAQEGKLVVTDDSEVVETAEVKYSKPTLSISLK